MNLRKLLLTSASLTLISGCFSKTELSNISNITQEDLDKKINESIQLVKITGVDSKNRKSECTGMFSGKRTVITLAFCVNDVNVSVHGIKPSKIYVSPDFRTVYHQSQVNRQSLLGLDNLAVLVFDEQVPSSLPLASDYGNKLSENLIHSDSYYFFQVARNQNELKRIEHSYAEESGNKKSTSYFMPSQIVKASNEQYAIESEQIVNFDVVLGDAGAPLIQVQKDRVKVVGLGAVITEHKGYNWPEKFLSVPLDFSSQQTQLLVQNISNETGASFEYLSR